MTQLFRASVAILVRRYFGNELRLLTVTNRRWGGFSCPGGKVERGETMEEAAIRELTEETGCAPLRIEPLIAGIDHSRPRDGGDPWFCMAFTADIGDQEPTLQEVGTEVAWRSCDELMEESNHPEWYTHLFRYIDPHVDLL